MRDDDLRAEIEWLQRAVVDTAADAFEIVVRLRAENEHLRADAARYRWLKRNPQWLGWEHDFQPDEVERAVDAAMKDKP